jgi:hypothetical protein
MTDERAPPEIPLEPFPVHRPESPFPPLYDSLPSASADPYSDWNRNADAHDLAVAHNAGRENRLVALGRFAFPPAPPLDDEGVAARDRRWTTRTIVIGAAFLLVFNAVSPLDMPRQGLREAWMEARDARFAGQEPAPPR